MQMFRGKCRSCGHVYDIVAIPAPIDVVATAVERGGCPMCGNNDGNTVANPRALTAEEIACKTARDHRPHPAPTEEPA